MTASGKEKLAFVDLLRGIAILMVAAVHTAIVVPGIDQFQMFLARYGQMGVQLFFVASAYTLAISYGRSNRDADAIKAFYVRRYFRIAPMYYLGVVLYFGLRVIKSLQETGRLDDLHPYSPLNVVANVLFVHGMVPSANNNIVPGGWSIGTEMLFYLVFPLLFAAAAGLRSRLGLRGVLLLLAACIALNAIVQIRVAGSWMVTLPNNSFFYLNLVNQLPVFMFGLLAYFATVDRVGIPAGCKESLVNGAAFVLLTLCGLLLWRFNGLNWTFVILPVVAGASFYFLLMFTRTMSVRIRQIERIGQLSYSIYVVHFLFAWYLAPRVMNRLAIDDSPGARFLLSFGLVLVGAFVVASLTERFVEARGIAVGGSLIARLRRGSAVDYAVGR